MFSKKYHDDKHLSPNTLEDIRHQLSNVNELIELPPIEIFFEDQQKHESCTVDHHKPSVNMNIVNMRKLLKETKDKKAKRDSERSQSFRPGKPSITHSYEHIIESCTVDHHKPSVNMNTVNMRKLLKKTNRDKLDLKFTEIEKQKRDSERSQSFRPGKPSITHSYEHIIEIAWQVPSAIPDCDSYEVYYRYVGDKEWAKYPTPVTNTKLKIGPFLKDNTYFEFKVRCMYNKVFGEYSEISEAIKTIYCRRSNCDCTYWFKHS
ncbi:unnamed protein product [Mytilus edulis]|uniref:Fibronectin type-III domain-containing protein n=1 Tax=Mytilus edulis TaxID=6550 RepID=A0A8S3RIF0_MYTED|nr:unnamed protein product [Mytilus edulis]